MPTSVTSPSPAMTARAAAPLVSSTSATAPHRRSASAAQSLADLYNARHAQESSVAASSDSLADLYNQRYEDDRRKEQPSSSSLADLYNQRFEDERQGESESDEIGSAVPNSTRHSRLAGPPTKHARRSNDALPNRAPSIHSADDDNPKPHSPVPSESDKLYEDSDDNSDIEVDSVSVLRDGSRREGVTRSVSIADQQNGSQIIVVPRSSMPRRGALGASATPLHFDSDDDTDRLLTPDPNEPSAPASSNVVLARPHTSPSKLVVQSSSSLSSAEASGSSTPPLPPNHRKGISVPHRVLGSTQDEESLNSMLRSDSALSRVASTSGRAGLGASSSDPSEEPNVSPLHVGPPEDVIIISDSEMGEMPVMPSSALLSDSEVQEASAGSESEQWHSAGGDAVAALDSSANPMRKETAEEREASEEMRGPTSSSRVSQVQGDVRAKPIAGMAVDPDAPIIVDERVAEDPAAHSSAAATPGMVSDGDWQRRYPKRARNVTDYNVKRAFERYERAKSEEIRSTQMDNSKPKKGSMSGKKPLPVVVASPAFFDAFQSSPTTKEAGRTAESSSFAAFLLAKAQSSASAASVLASNAVTLRSTDTPVGLTEAQAREIPDRGLDPAALWDIPVRTDDVGSLFQLKPSTRRWLGIAGPNRQANIEGEVHVLDLPRARPIEERKRKLSSFIATHCSARAHLDRLPAVLDMFSDTALIGRARDAVTMESASRRIRLGRAVKLPLPATLRPIADMEHQEWVRLGENLPEISRMAEDWKLREQGHIMVDEEDTDWIHTHLDITGRRRFSKLTCVTGGELRIYYDLHNDEPNKPDEPDVPKNRIKRIKVVRRSSHTKSPSASRLASTSVRDTSDPETETVAKLGGIGAPATADSVAGTPDMPPARSEIPVPVFDLQIPATPLDAAMLQQRREKAVIPVETSKVKRPVSSGPSSHSKVAPKTTSVSKVKAATTSSGVKGTPDLRTFFSTQPSPQQPPAKSASTTASAKAKGKARALDDDIKAWSHKERNTNSSAEIFIDLTHSSSASESIGSRHKRVRSPSPSRSSSVSSKQTAISSLRSGMMKRFDKKKRTVGLGSNNDPFLVAEAKRKEAQKNRVSPVRSGSVNEAERTATNVSVQSSALSSAGVRTKKRRRLSDEESEPGTPPPPPSRSPFKQHKAVVQNSSAGTSRLPQATPSPTRGGWQGISGWYTNTRDAFSPTPVDDRPSKRNEDDKDWAKRQGRLEKLLWTKEGGGKKDKKHRQ